MWQGKDLKSNEIVSVAKKGVMGGDFGSVARKGVSRDLEREEEMRAGEKTLSNGDGKYTGKDSMRVTVCQWVN